MWQPYVRIGSVILTSLALFAACKPRNQYQPLPPPDVTVDRPLQRDVTEYLVETGQLAAINSVDLMARVQGYLQAIEYKDGTFVTKGTNLFTIEPAPYRAQVAAAQANLASAEARAAFSGRQYSRYSALLQREDSSREQTEQTLSDRDAANAAVDQARAALEQAGITYSYTHVTAPFDGIVTAHQADVGAVVGGSQATQLATIVQLDPIWVNFNISEQDVLRTRTMMAAHGASAARLDSVTVQVGLQDEVGYPHAGHLDYAAPGIDPGTGTLSVRGILSNPTHALLPGYFVHIRIPVGVRKGALLVPASALGDDKGGRTLMVVTSANVVESRSVTLGPRDGALQVVESGLTHDDRVIVDGLQRVRPGQKVVPHDAPPRIPSDGPGHG